MHFQISAYCVASHASASFLASSTLAHTVSCGLSAQPLNHLINFTHPPPSRTVAHVSLSRWQWWVLCWVVNHCRLGVGVLLAIFLLLKFKCFCGNPVFVFLGALPILDKSAACCCRSKSPVHRCPAYAQTKTASLWKLFGRKKTASVGGCCGWMCVNQ